MAFEIIRTSMFFQRKSRVQETEILYFGQKAYSR